MEILSRSLEDTAGAAAEQLERLSKRVREKASVLALYGDLGSGKTTFTQFLAKELGITDYVTSPTFVIEKRYKISPTFQGGVAAGRGGYHNFIHIDCYRLSNSAEMLALDWLEIVEDPGNLIVVEWPERIEGILPADAVRIQFEYVGEGERKINLS